MAVGIFIVHAVVSNLTHTEVNKTVVVSINVTRVHNQIFYPIIVSICRQMVNNSSLRWTLVAINFIIMACNNNVRNFGTDFYLIIVAIDYEVVLKFPNPNLHIMVWNN